MSIKWTDEQLKIIESRNKNILVSASAGSGKTTVMIERILSLMINEHVPISNFLVVTFTKASAADMKQKMITELMKHQDDAFCLQQIDAVDTSDISNLHSFCSRLISTYFYEVNIDPSFKVLDDATSSFLQEKALEKLFEQKEKQGDIEYFKLYDIFQKKRQNAELKNVIKRFNNFLNANLKYSELFKKHLDEAYNLDLSKNSCAKLINNFVSNRIEDLAEEIGEFAKVCHKNKLDKIYDYFNDVALAIKIINKRNSYIQNAQNLFELKFQKCPVVPSNLPLKSQIEDMKNYIKRQIEDFQKNYICADEELLLEGLKETKQRVESLYSLVLEFNAIYDELKKEVNGLDFNDLEKYALSILKNTEILESIKQKYKYVFVDEYQDINSVQEEIISLVSSENNRFMVGDIKQSIYRFRLCDPDIFLKKYEDYGSGKNALSELHKLNCNFRSDKKILKFVDDVFSGVMTEKFGGIDYSKDSRFVAGENNLDLASSVNLCLIDMTKNSNQAEKVSGVYSVRNHIQPEIEDEERGVVEARLVADKIAKIIESVGAKDFKYSDIAILVGSRNAVVAKFIEELKAYGIPVASDEKYNVLEKPYVQEIINFINLLCNHNDDITLFKVLKSRLFNFSDNELVEIRLLDKNVKFFEIFKLIDNIENLELRKKLQNFNEIIDIYSKFAQILSIKQLCKKIIDDFSLYQINEASLFSRRANEDIEMFIEALPDTTPFDFSMNYENFNIEVENECGGNNVSVMTVHKSKGIEFKYVFLINVVSEFNFESTYENVIFNKDFGVGLRYFDVNKRFQMESVASSGMRLLEKRKLVEEQQRVLYVALTRAKEKLFVICSKEKEKIVEQSRRHKRCFFDWFEPFVYRELYGKGDKDINFEMYSANELFEKSENEQNTLFFVDDGSNSEPAWFEYKYSDAQNFALKSSISKIIKTEKPSDLKYQSGGSSADRGSAYHRVFEMLDYKQIDDIEKQIDELFIQEKIDEKIVNKNTIKNIAKMPIFREISVANHIFKEREFYAKLSTNIIKQTNADSDFVLQGVFDLVAVFDDHLIVLDYKTGKIDDLKLGEYKFQLNTYADVAEKIFEKRVQKKILCLIDEQKILEI